MRRLYYLRMFFIVIMVMIFGLNMKVYPAKKQSAPESFYFVQLSDTHWGFTGTNINPDSAGTLKKTVDEVNNLKIKPDFIIFTGDLTHTTDDPQVRRQRMTEFKSIISGLNVKDIKFIPGEHDAGLDKGEAYKEFFGKTYYTFNHKGVHFIALDNVSDPTSSIGDEQLKWLGKVLGKLKKDSRIVVFTHRPIFDLYPDWDWWTRDGAKARELLKPFKHVIVFFGHIHQQYTQMIDQANYYAAKGLMYPLPAPGSVPKKAPVPWNPDKPYDGLGFRVIEVNSAKPEYTITEYPVSEAGDSQVIKVEAQKFKFTPDEIHVKAGREVILQLTSLDRVHGFASPELGLKAKIEPGKITEVRFNPDKPGTNSFHCDIFCGDGHEDMTGRIIVEE